MHDIKALCDQVRETAYAIHVYHGPGHLEKVYENAVAHRLRKQGLDVKQQHRIQVYDDDGTVIGDYLADLLVADVLIVELKAAKSLGPEHEAQVLGCLKIRPTGARLTRRLRLLQIPDPEVCTFPRAGCPSLTRRPRHDVLCALCVPCG